MSSQRVLRLLGDGPVELLEGAVVLGARLVDAGQEDAGGDVLRIDAEGGLEGDLGLVVFLQLDEDPAQGHERRRGCSGWASAAASQHAPRFVEVAHLAVALGQAELGQLVVRAQLQRLAERGDRVGHLAGRAMGLPELDPHRGVAGRELGGLAVARDRLAGPALGQERPRLGGPACAGGGSARDDAGGALHTWARATSATSRPGSLDSAAPEDYTSGYELTGRTLRRCPACRRVGSPPARFRRLRGREGPDPRRPRHALRGIRQGRPAGHLRPAGLHRVQDPRRAVRVHRPRGRPLVVPERRRPPGVRRPPAAARRGEPAGLDDLREAARAAADPHPRGAGARRSSAGPPARRRSSRDATGAWTRASTGRRSWTSSSAGRRR